MYGILPMFKVKGEKTRTFCSECHFSSRTVPILTSHPEINKRAESQSNHRSTALYFALKYRMDSSLGCSHTPDTPFALQPDC